MSFASDLIPIRNHKRAQADVLLPSQAWLGAAVTFTIAHATAISRKRPLRAAMIMGPESDKDFDAW
jgi:hypothetical protein